MRNVRFFVAILLALLVIPAIAKAQNVASVTGSVTDASGAAVPGASVKLTDTRTGDSHFAKTAGDGTYRIVDVAPGPGYTLTIKKDGFQTFIVNGLYLPVATTSTQDVRLELGTLSQTVEVTAQGSVTLNTTDATIGNNFDMRQITDLPIQFRDNPALLLQLQPGVTPTSDVPDDPLGIRGGAVTGARTDQNNIVVDGIDAQDFAIGEAFAQVAVIPIDSILEFRTEVANPISDTGRGSGATSFISTKGGSNEWHGAAREYNRTAATEANSFFNNQTGVPRPQLTRNQFGADLGGPVLKDKLFFFFDYDGRRDAHGVSVLRFVPLDHVRNGEIAYINNSNDNSCPNSSRLGPQDVNTPCVTILQAAGDCGSQTVQGLDPQCIGAAPALTSFLASRYPHANDTTAGDGINTGGFRFNAAAPFTENIYVARIDYNLSSKHKIFTRFNFDNGTSADATNNPGLSGDAAPEQFPGDPTTQEVIKRDKAWVIGDTWAISSNSTNQFVYGESRNDLSFPHPFNPNGTLLQFNWMGNFFDPPYIRQTTQARLIPVPTFRDDFSTIHGSHALTFGGVWKPIRTRDVQVNDFSFIGTGLPPNTSLTSAFRPADILDDPSAQQEWDNMFDNALGIWWEDAGVFNYTAKGTALPPGAAHRVDYRYYEYEFYAQDTWKVTKNLTVTYGLRYQYDSVPYETKGIEAVSNVDFNTEFNTRVASGLAGIDGFDAAPLLTFGLAGKANPNSPSLYHNDPTNFSPRLAVAWNPTVDHGFLSSILGDRKTVFRGSASMIYDHTALNSVNFIQDQNNFLFSNQGGGTFFGPAPADTLNNNPRFTGINDQPVVEDVSPPVAPPFTNPLTPFVAGDGTVFGTFVPGVNYAVDPHLKTPYSLAFSAGMQRELPDGVQLELDWIGRYAHRLIGLADASQLTDFVDKTPGVNQSLIQALTLMENDARTGAATSEQPFFEDPAICGPGCSDFIFSNLGDQLALGNTDGVVFTLQQIGGLPPNVGLPPQFVGNLYLTNKGWSNYNALALILRKRFSNNLQGDFNYTYSHSIDNFSVIANNNGNFAGTTNGALCDVTSLHACKGDSEFDLTHAISADYIYDLPFGRGQRFGKDSSTWLNEAIGGWSFSGVIFWHSGFPFNPLAGVSTTSLFNDAFAVFTGPKSAIGNHLHMVGQQVQLFRDPTAASNAFTNPTGLQVGNRNILRGPGFSNFDMALVKNFPIGGERYHLQFRAEAYNVFNHTNFALPSAVFNSPTTFGVITETASASRVMQFALRFDF